ncbi:Serine/threonine-protein phosphatase 7 long form-like protein [Hordeum vulgare]|nr:Serine/threonine-protein phosphatase 7 long form-like protein [Hordeum vulgare]
MGHLEKLAHRPRTDYGEDDDEARFPTIAYAWDVVGVYTGTSKVLYKVFTYELDGLAAFKVNWRLYEREWGFELNVTCRHNMLPCRCIVPMICVYAVEHHLPHRVAVQFDKVQRTPPDRHIDTGGSNLHLMSTQKNQSITN